MARRNSQASMMRWLSIAVLVVALDQVTKALIVNFFAYAQAHRVTSFFNIIREHNTGAAFSFLAGASGWQRWFFIGLASVAVLVILWLLRRHAGQRLFALALALILGGAIGNVIDRVVRSYVVDFIQVHYRGWFFPAFNVADSAITVGAMLLILDELLRVRRSR